MGSTYVLVKYFYTETLASQRVQAKGFLVASQRAVSYEPRVASCEPITIRTNEL